MNIDEQDGQDEDLAFIPFILSIDVHSLSRVPVGGIVSQKRGSGIF
jgi:hypothetical protein